MGSMGIAEHPYRNLPDYSDWRRSVADRNMFAIADLWQPRFEITRSMPIATFGSCFAQHIGRSMRDRGFSWLNCEPAPPGLSKENAKRYSYDVFSARTGNIYTSSILKQWTEWAAGIKSPPDGAWKRNGRFIDPFRPRIEPDGFASAREMVASRALAIARFRRCIEQADIFVFTLGLTESWFNKSGGYEYPLCPGTAAGTFDKEEHIFVNQGYEEVRSHLIDAFSIMRAINPSLRFLLTVSPVPLVATNAGRHVLVSTMASKSILRAVAESVSGTKVASKSRLADAPAKPGVDWVTDWAVSGVHEISEHGLTITGPGHNPFCGIRSRNAFRVIPGDEIIVRIAAESCASITLHLTPTSRTRQNGIRSTKTVKNGIVEFRLAMDRAGSAIVWASAADSGKPIIFKDISVESRSATAGLIDYFPSYEIINSPAFGGVFFERDKREVSAHGVDFVMNQFFAGLNDVGVIAASTKKDQFDVICDELVLESFARAAE